MTQRIKEDDVERAALAWLQDLGWSYVHGTVLAPDGDAPERKRYSDVILEGRLRAALARINPQLPASAIDEAARRVLMAHSPALEESNRAFQQWLVEGVRVQVQKDGHTRGEQVWLVDVHRPDNNDWLASNQFTIIDGNHNRRPDILLFVNGMPVAVLELKNPEAPKATLKDAWRQLQTYKARIPGLFVTNQVLVISDGTQSRVGSLTAGFERFVPWRVIDGPDLDKLDDPDDQDNQDDQAAEAALAAMPELEVVVRGLFQRKRFLDYMRNFVLWEVGDAYVKKIAGYHQFHAVRKAVAATTRVAARGSDDRRVGVIWHTQGSGKSLSMLFYVAKLIQEPAMENPTIVVLTDRNDLDGQLYNQFQLARDLLPAPVQADSREHLRALLQVASGGIVFTTIQKFGLTDEERSAGQTFPVLSERRNIVVVADEAHRSQYGFKQKLDEHTGKLSSGLAKNLRDALPHAAYLGFTGTPIELDDKSTRLIFGRDLDRYTIRQAQRDGATVPIHYEARVAKLELRQDQHMDIDESFDELTDDLSEAEREKLKNQWARLEAMVGTKKRIELVARDMVEHFERRQEGLAGKGMIVCMSRRICADLYRAMVKLRPAWHGQDDKTGAIKVVITGASTDRKELQDHIRSKQGLKEIARRFKDDTDPLMLVIVCDMWLTGFDAPCVHTMYIDKPMQGHGLMQAIARVNRVYKDKPAGLVVDYLGVAEQLKSAVRVYSGHGDAPPGVPVEEALALLQEKLDVVRAMFHGFDARGYHARDPGERLRALQAGANHVLGLDDGKQRFLDAMSALGRAAAIAQHLEEARPFRDDIAFYQAVERNLRKHTVTAAGGGAVELDAAIRQIVSRAVVSRGVVDIFGEAGMAKPELSILSDEFLDSMKQSEHKNLQVEVLNKLLSDQITAMRQRNLVQARRFSEMLAHTLVAYQNRTVESAQVLLQLIDMAKEVRDSPQRGKALGLSDDELAFYDALADHGNVRDVMGDQVLGEIARDLVDTIRKSVTIDWTQKESVRAKLRTRVKRLLKDHGYPPDKRKEAIHTVIEQAEEICKDWALAA